MAKFWYQNHIQRLLNQPCQDIYRTPQNTTHFYDMKFKSPTFLRWKHWFVDTRKLQQRVTDRLKQFEFGERNTQQRMKYCHMQLGFNVTKCLICNTIINYCTNRKTKKRKPGVETWFISRVMNNWCCDSMNKFFQALTSFISSKHFSKNLCERLFFWLQKGHKKKEGKYSWENFR